MKTYREWMYSITIFTSALDGGEWSVSLTCRFNPGKRTPGTHWIGGWVGSRPDVDAVEWRKIKKKKWHDTYCEICRSDGGGYENSSLVGCGTGRLLQTFRNKQLPPSWGLSWRWKQAFPPKHQYRFNRPYGVISQKAVSLMFGLNKY
jgi:hypothetical protein